jgi:hypothetical protein
MFTKGGGGRGGRGGFGGDRGRGGRGGGLFFFPIFKIVFCAFLYLKREFTKKLNKINLCSQKVKLKME